MFKIVLKMLKTCLHIYLARARSRVVRNINLPFRELNLDHCFLAGKWTKPETTTKETNENKTINKVQNPIRAQVHSCISFCRMSQPTTSSVNFCDFIINYMFSSLALPSEWWDTHITVKIHAKWCTAKPLMDLKPWYAAIAKPHSPSP